MRVIEMSDDNQQNSETEPEHQKWLGVASIGSAIIAILLVLGIDMLMRGPAAYRQHFTCVICRLSRTEVKWKNDPTEITFHDNSCSKWYPAHVEPSHEHLWSKGATVATLNFYGQVIGVGDNFDHPGRAIKQLTPEEQIEIYKHFSDPLVAKHVFISLMDPDVMKHYDNRGDYLITNSLKAWVDSGCSGPWKDPLEKKR